MTENSQILNVNSTSSARPVIASAITPEIHQFYVEQCSETENNIKQLGAETHQCLDRQRLVNSVTSNINHLTDEQGCLDISQRTDILEEMQILRELGVPLPEGKLKLTAVERDRLIANLQLAADSWVKENQTRTQKMDILIKHLDRLVMLLKEVYKNEKDSKRAAIAGIKGG